VMSAVGEDLFILFDPDVVDKNPCLWRNPLAMGISSSLGIEKESYAATQF
jgi:hypothetical protein